MTPNDLINLTSMVMDGAIAEITKKAPDYAPGGVCFVDLIRACADIEQPRPEVALWTLMSKHITALRRYALGGELKSETLANRVFDTINYAAMLHIWASLSHEILRDVATYYTHQRCECPEPMVDPIPDPETEPCDRCLVLGWFARYHPDSLTASTSAPG